MLADIKVLKSQKPWFSYQNTYINIYLLKFTLSLIYLCNLYLIVILDPTERQIATNYTDNNTEPSGKFTVYSTFV